jgi:GDP-L-fucose synthase
VQDFARGLMLTAEKFAVAEPVNIGTNEEVSIKHLVDVILAVTGKTPEVIFDTSHPEGQPRRNCDTKKMQRVLGWEPEIALEEGIRRTVDWYRANC